MKINKWTSGLAAVGLVSLASVAQAEEKSVPLMTALSSTVISGYVDTSIVWNPGTGNANPAPISFNHGKQDGFNLNVVNLTLEKPLDEAQWSAGYKAELLFGPDAVGFNTSANAGSSADFAIKQAYVALRAPLGNGLDTKIGVLDSPLGYESFAGYRNPNYTRSYGYTIEPTQLTGILSTYQICDVLAISAGAANTVNEGINERSDRAESAKAYMGSITLTAPESMGALAGSALYAGIIDGFAGSTDEDQTSIYLGATIATGVTGLKLGASYDEVHHLGGAESHGYADAYAVYASLQATEKMSLHVRGEYAAVSQLFEKRTRVLALTGTVQYDLWQHVISRLEVRWDHATSGGDSFGGTSSGEPTKKNEFMVAANLIYVF